MSPRQALQDPVVLFYLAVVFGLLLFAGLLFAGLSLVLRYALRGEEKTSPTGVLWRPGVA